MVGLLAVAVGLLWWELFEVAAACVWWILPLMLRLDFCCVTVSERCVVVVLEVLVVGLSRIVPKRLIRWKLVLTWLRLTVWSVVRRLESLGFKLRRVGQWTLKMAVLLLLWFLC